MIKNHVSKDMIKIFILKNQSQYIYIYKKILFDGTFHRTNNLVLKFYSITI